MDHNQLTSNPFVSSVNHVTKIIAMPGVNLDRRGGGGAKYSIGSLKQAVGGDLGAYSLEAICRILYF